MTWNLRAPRDATARSLLVTTALLSSCSPTAQRHAAQRAAGASREPTPASLNAAPQSSSAHEPGSNRAVLPEPAEASSDRTEVDDSDPATLDNSFGGWGVSDWCIGGPDDVQPPPCADATGCYKLQLNDLRVTVVSVMGRGVALDDAMAHYRSIDAQIKERHIKGCFAHELGRGRPPTGTVRIDVVGTAGQCAQAEAKIIEKNVGAKTAECVRDALQRYRLPSAVAASSPEISVGIEVAVEGL